MMKINQKLLSIALLGAILGLTSCHDDDESNSSLSQAEAQAKLSETNHAVVTDLQDLSSSDGLTVIKDLSDLIDTDDPFTSRIGSDRKSIKLFFREKGYELKKIFIPSSINGRTQEDGFDYNSNKGVYSWDASNQVFVKTEESSEINIFFPTEGSETNNAELRISQYEEVELYDETQLPYYNPSVIKASVLVNNNKIASVDLDINWNEDGFPESVDLTLFVSPFTATVSFNATSTTSTLSTTLKKNNELLLSTSVTVKFEDDSKTLENLNTVEGYVQIRNIKIQGSVDIKASDELENVDPNNYIHLSLYDQNKKAGDIIFKNEEVDGNEEYVAYVQYSNGDTEKLETLFKDAIDEFNTLVDDLGDNG